MEQKSWLSKTYVVKAGNQGIALDDAEGPPEPENLSDDGEPPEGKLCQVMFVNSVHRRMIDDDLCND